MSEYPKGIIDLRRLTKKDAVSIEPGRKSYFVDDRTFLCACGQPRYESEAMCEDCFIENPDYEMEHEHD